MWKLRVSRDNIFCGVRMSFFNRMYGCFEMYGGLSIDTEHNYSCQLNPLDQWKTDNSSHCQAQLAKHKDSGDYSDIIDQQVGSLTLY